MDKKRDQNLFNEPFVIDLCKIFLLILTSYFARHVQKVSNPKNMMSGKGTKQKEYDKSLKGA